MLYKNNYVNWCISTGFCLFFVILVHGALGEILVGSADPRSRTARQPIHCSRYEWSRGGLGALINFQCLSNAVSMKKPGYILTFRISLGRSFYTILYSSAARNNSCTIHCRDEIYIKRSNLKLIFLQWHNKWRWLLMRIFIVNIFQQINLVNQPMSN